MPNTCFSHTCLPHIPGINICLYFDLILQLKRLLNLNYVMKEEIYTETIIGECLRIPNANLLPTVAYGRKPTILEWIF